jgi:hypothetical protein
VDYVLEKDNGRGQNTADRPVSEGRGYFLARFFGFFWDVGAERGSGGVFSIARSKSSVRRSAIPRGRNSSAGLSALRFMVES